METNRTNCHFARLPALIACALAVLLLPACETTQTFRLPRGLQPAGDFDTVVIDAGHGGHDSGARAVSGAPEKQL
ncbi:MAG: hypothetical protein ACKOHM_10555, partial [Spartobacteria bacterium]